MNAVQPIRDKRVIEGIQSYLKTKNGRDYVLFCTGIYTGFRISDLLSLRVADMLDTHISIREGKTNKLKRVLINSELRAILDPYLIGKHQSEFMFPARSKKIKSGLKQRPLDRSTVYKMLNRVARQFRLKDIGCHTMRKTFGYHMYMKNPRNLALLMNIFNHSSETVTLRYIGITQDMIDDAVDDLSYS